MLFGYDNYKKGFNELNQSLKDIIIIIGSRSNDDCESKHKFRVGLFDEKRYDRSDKETGRGRRRRHLAREAAEQSILMLLNRDETLPIDFSNFIGGVDWSHNIEIM